MKFEAWAVGITAGSREVPGRKDLWQETPISYYNNNNNNNNNNTDREVTANRPDIIIKNKKEKTRTLIDVAIPTDRNVVQKEAEKKLKYKSLCIEIQRMWNLKCTIVPVIIGATGIVTRREEKFGNYIRKTFDRFTTKDSYTWNITHNTESTAMWSLKPERWGSPVVQQKYQEEMPVTGDMHIV